MRAILIVAIVFGAVTMPRPLAAQAPALFGTWTVNLAKSTFSTNPPPFKRETCTVESHGDGVRVSYDIVGTRGGVTHIEWQGAFDGRDYAVQGVDSAMTHAYRVIDERTYQVLVKVDGGAAGMAIITVSPDGQTMTTVTTAMNAQGQDVGTTTVFERQ